MAILCCSPPESWLVLCPARSRRPTESRAARARACRSLLWTLVYRRGSSTFSRAGRPGEEVEGLEDEPDLLVPDAGQLVLVERGDVLSLQEILARRGFVETAQDVHQAGFPGAGGAHDGQEFALLDHIGHAPEGPDLGVPDLVGLDQVLELDDLLGHGFIPSFGPRSPARPHHEHPRAALNGCPGRRRGRQPDDDHLSFLQVAAEDLGEGGIRDTRPDEGDLELSVRILVPDSGRLAHPRSLGRQRRPDRTS